jgi:enamine deaminase RidA (YjgF/YER057c/UK114 family)
LNASESRAQRRLISSGSPFEAACGYSRAVVDGEFVFISGTTGYDYATMTMPDDVADQARNVCKTFAAVLAQAGGGLEDIVSLRTFVVRPEYCQPVLAVQGEVFAAIRPAAAIVVVAGLLTSEMKVEIEAVARLSTSR